VDAAMHRQDLNDMLAFMAVARERSFTKAAAKLGTSQSTLSHTIRQLEQRLGLRLLMRTTRNVSPTDAGERLLRTLAPSIHDIEREVDAMMELRDKPSGVVRLTLSDHAFDWIAWPKLAPTLKEYPDIKVEFSIDNGFRDIIEERLDAGVRLGESVDKDMVAVRISPDWRLVAVASPAYLKSSSPIETPQDLVAHNCMNHRQSRSGGLYAWEFAKNGRDLRVRVEGQLTFSSSLAMVGAAISGLGIAYVPENLVTDALASGQLVQVLDAWSPMFSGYYLYYPSRRQHSPAFAVIVEALRQDV
jgi:DNA-binding transcriptional LysR family regulator